MIESYLTDTIEIRTETFDVNGVRTAVNVQAGVKARIEDKNRTVRNTQGQEVASTCFLMVDAAAMVKYGDKVRLLTQNGAATQYPTKDWAILSLGRGHRFGFEFWRVWL